MQVELPWALGPADGRYVLRGHAGEPHARARRPSLGAPAAPGAPRLARRRARPVDPEPRRPRSRSTRVTLVAAEPFPSEDEARAWLDGADGEAEAAEALTVLRRVLHAHRIAGRRPFGRPSRRASRRSSSASASARASRWPTAAGRRPSSCRPRPAGAGGRRRGGCEPQERLAALLGGRDAALAARS